MTTKSESSDITSVDRDRSELGALYPKPKPINTNPISTPEEIAERKRKAYEKQVRLLRRKAFRIGLYIAIPYVFGLIAVQQVVLSIPFIAPEDIGGAMFIVFSSFLMTSLTVVLAYFLFRQAGEVFNHHYLKAWPVIVGILVSIIGVSPSAFDIGNTISISLLGYITSLAIIAAASVIISVFLIYVWTSKLTQQMKVVILSIIAIAALVLLFL